jgi:acetyl-CoA C-acetyltransferase
MNDLVICDVVRTPFGFANRLSAYSAPQLLETAVRALLERTAIPPSEVCGVIAGSVQQDTKAPNLARIASRKAGLPEATVDYTIQSNCNSAFVSLMSAMGEIANGQGEVWIAGGAESMSNYGFRLKGPSDAYGSVQEIDQALRQDVNAFLESFSVVHCLEEGLTDQETNISMIEIGEVMANCFGISREEQDAYTMQGLQRAVEAVEGGLLDGYIVPLGESDKDGYPLNRKRMLKRPESIARAAPVFGEDNPVLPPAKFCEKHRRHLDRLGVQEIVPTVTMYNSCIPGDGAGACLVTTEDKAKALEITPKLRILGWAKAGVDPVIMGIGPMESTRKLFAAPMTERAKGLDMDALDMIEIHEAFAAQVLSVFKEGERRYGQNWDLEKVNVYGGSLAYTHPLGATNCRLLANILSRFDNDPSAQYAMACGCAGGGMGASVLVERYGE